MKKENYHKILHGVSVLLGAIAAIATVYLFLAGFKSLGVAAWVATWAFVLGGMHHGAESRITSLRDVLK